jgi:hypothetical protein
MYRRAFEEDPPIYTINFKLHYSVKYGDAVYLNIKGSTYRMTYGRDQHGDIWTFTLRYSHGFIDHNHSAKYSYFIAKYDYEKNIKQTICYANSEEVLER